MQMARAAADRSMQTGSEALVVPPRMNTVTLSDVVLLGTFTGVQTNEWCVNIQLIVTGHNVDEYCIRGTV